MTDAYNVAVKHLKQKYDIPVLLNYGDVPQRIAQDHDDHELFLLINQYNSLRYEPKRELELKLTRMNIAFEKIYT